MRPLRWWGALIGLVLVGACLLSIKNTTFLLVFTVLLACVAVWVGRVAAAVEFDRDPHLVKVANRTHAGHHNGIAIVFTLYQSVGDKPGERFPGTVAIASEFDVSQSTAQKAVAALRAEGRLRTVLGQGSFVSDPLPKPGKS